MYIYIKICIYIDMYIYIYIYIYIYKIEDKKIYHPNLFMILTKLIYDHHLQINFFIPEFLTLSTSMLFSISNAL